MHGVCRPPTHAAFLAPDRGTALGYLLGIERAGEILAPNSFLGEFEHMVLLAILQSGDHAFALEVRRELEGPSRAERLAGRLLHDPRPPGGQGPAALGRGGAPRRPPGAEPVDARSYHGIARLPAGAAREGAVQEVETVTAGALIDAGAGDDALPVVRPWREHMIDPEARVILAAMPALTGLVLLTACANVANLLLARARRPGPSGFLRPTPSGPSRTQGPGESSEPSTTLDLGRPGPKI